MNARALLVAWLLFCSGMAATASPPGAMTRDQALRFLGDDVAEVRRAAAARLAEVGRGADAKALIARLKDGDGEVREAAHLAIWSVWSRSGDAKVDQMLAAGTVAMNGGDFDRALALFTQVIKRKPAFAEGWNKRATLYFFAGRLKESLADCDQVMKFNPDHFGALAGYGQIWLQLGDFGKSLNYFERALAINPTMEGVVANIENIRRAQARERARGV